MSELRAGLPPLPSRMQTLRVDARGYPVPWFVAWVGDTPDFRVVKPNAMVEALRFHLCWICGQQLGRHRAFVIGPMCAINRISSEPPSHCDCAHFAAQACPFLTIPSSHRRESGLEDLGAVDPAGFAIKRNPGVALVWVTKSFRPFRAERGVLIRVGDPHELHWYAEGREATAEEVAESIGTGFPILWREAQAESPEAVDESRPRARRSAAIAAVRSPRAAGRQARRREVRRVTEDLIAWREALMAWGALLWLLAGVVLLFAAVVEGVRSFLIDVSGEEKPPEELW